MKLVSHKNGILHIEFPNRKELCMTMGRPQEYYESGHKHLRNKIFTLEQFIDTFTDERGYFSYYQDWSGFNIPSKKFYEFFDRNDADNITEREWKLYELVVKNANDNNSYIIATMAGDSVTIDHEIAHGLYSLNKVYKRRADKLVKELDKEVHQKLITIFAEWGYGKNVWTDEINAYMSTSSPAYMKKNFKLTKISNHMKPFRELFKEFNT